MATIDLREVMANFTTSLASKISSAAVAMTINRSTDDDGGALASTYWVVVDEGTNSEEHMIVTFAGAAGTIVKRGLSRVDMNTEQAANKFEHSRGASVKIVNASLVVIHRLLNGTDTFNAVDWTGVNSISGLATPLAGETSKAANVAYANALAIAGAPDAGLAVKGIVEQATAAQTKAGTANGDDTSAKLFATPEDIAGAVQDSSWSYAADAEASDAYVITLVPAVTAYAAGQVFYFKANTANTGAATLNVNGLGAKTIKTLHDQDLQDGDIESGAIVHVVYDGTNFQMLSASAGTITTADITRANITTLTDGSDADSLHIHNTIIAYSTAAATVNSTTSETTIFTESIPGGTLGTDKGINLRVYVTDTNSFDVSHSLTIRVKYGGTLIADIAYFPDVNSLKGYIDVDLFADAATNAQQSKYSIHFMESGADASASTNDVSVFTFGGRSAAIDSTSDQDLIMTVQPSNSAGNTKVTIGGYRITKL